MTNLHSLPSISQVDFYRFTQAQFLGAVSTAIARHLSQFPKWKPSPHHEAIHAWGRLRYDVFNGGFEQFFYNHGGDTGMATLAELLDTLDLPKAATLFRKAVSIYQEHEREFKVSNPFDGLFGSIKEFDKLERSFSNFGLRCDRAIEGWIRSKVSELFVDEQGGQIDPVFSGSVQIYQPNGLIGAFLEVKKGKPHGAYREFFDDGTLRDVKFYKSGKQTGDYWPNGQLRRKISKRGDLTVSEWYFPTGQLQKRHVEDKKGNIVEPVRRYHENGQLAEEIHFEGSHARGLWLKFFEDGTPQLKAENGPDTKLIVHDAWDENRTQVVKDGTGLFYDDGVHFDCSYALFLELDWQKKIEFHNGLRHGPTTTYRNGIPWSIETFSKGLQHGESKRFWNNGRIKTMEAFVNGEKKESQSFPKFDHPKPAVILTLQADEKLYEAWKHIKIDDYPQPLNLAEIKNQLKVPPFLQAVFERNLSNSIKNNYENWSSFDDGISYFLKLNESGEVLGASAGGSGGYSGGSWDVYPPLLKQLRFTPARIRGHAVPCTVLANVNHTFVEGNSSELSDNLS